MRALLVVTLVLAGSLLTAACLPEGLPSSKDWRGSDGSGVYDAAYGAEIRRIRAAEIAACPGGDLMRQATCRVSRRVDMEDNNPRLRGTDAYCQANYASLGVTALKDKAAELAGLWHRANTNVLSSSINVTRGEVTREQIDEEYGCVRGLLRKHRIRIPTFAREMSVPPTAPANAASSGFNGLFN